MLSDRTDNSSGVAAAEGGASGQPPLGSSQLKGSEKKVVVLFVLFLVRVPTSRMNDGIFVASAPPMADQPLFSISSIEAESHRTALTLTPSSLIPQVG